MSSLTYSILHIYEVVIFREMYKEISLSRALLWLNLHGSCCHSQLYLASDQRTFLKCARRSRLQEVSLSSHTSFLTCWQVVYLDPQERMENEGLPVPVSPHPAPPHLLFFHQYLCIKLCLLSFYSYCLLCR